mmetsp:Transcript_27130/g.49843  ORF Transcript_27130/g.49843 Transcript_27130/m.49843 type:complete len:217 (-) Transcript_27130:318-968(-)
MQVGAATSFSQSCPPQLTSFPHAFVVVPQCQWPQAAPPVLAPCSSTVQIDRSKPNSGVFGIVGVSKLPSTPAANKPEKPRKKARRRGGRATTLTQEQCAEDNEQHGGSSGQPTESYAAGRVVICEVEAEDEPPSAAPLKNAPPTCSALVAHKAPARRRWADISDDEDDDQWDTFSSHTSESTCDWKCGSLGFSDGTSTRGSTSGDCTDTECSDDEA